MIKIKSELIINVLEGYHFLLIGNIYIKFNFINHDNFCKFGAIIEVNNTSHTYHKHVLKKVQFI